MTTNYFLLISVILVLAFTGCSSTPEHRAVIIDLIEEAIQPAPTPVPTPEQELPERNIEDDSPFPPANVSRSGRFLWKPDSETERGVAILLPWQERGYVEEVVVTWEGGQIRIPRHNTNERWVNGARPHFFTYKHRSAFGTGPVYVTAQRTDGQPRRWVVSNPQVRDER